MSPSSRLTSLLSLVLALGSVHCSSSDAGSRQSNTDNASDGADTGGDSAPADSGVRRNLDASVVPHADAAAIKNDAGQVVSTLDGGKPNSSASDDAGPLIISSYVNLALPDGLPFDKTKGDTHPSAGFTPPTGWNWYNIDGAKCRDGSQFGVFVHWGDDPSKLFIYFEGGGACANSGFCRLNPVNVSQQFLTGGESAAASLVILPVPQGPNGAGVFDLQNAANPFHGWSEVFIPYCTGDVYAGTRTNVMVDGVAEPQNFYGGDNTKKVISRLSATFKQDVTRFVAGGSSAGGYGAGINFGYIQDTFSSALGSVILDASPPFTNDYVPVCLQQRWRDTWGVDGQYPSDCGETCRSADGGNLFGIVDYLRQKYPRGTVALISGIHDEIIRLFFSLGNDNCANYGLDPETLFIGSVGQTYDPDKFAAGLQQLRTKYLDTNRFSTYFMDGFPNATAHQCLFRDRFYQAAAGDGKATIADFIKQFVDGTMTQVGP